MEITKYIKRSEKLFCITLVIGRIHGKWSTQKAINREYQSQKLMLSLNMTSLKSTAANDWWPAKLMSTVKGLPSHNSEKNPPQKLIGKYLKN